MSCKDVFHFQRIFNGWNAFANGDQYKMQSIRKNVAIISYLCVGQCFSMFFPNFFMVSIFELLHCSWIEVDV